jgi:FKBP-type peptidyl-prolyl cis-trans isomerase
MSLKCERLAYLEILKNSSVGEKASERATDNIKNIEIQEITSYQLLDKLCMAQPGKHVAGCYTGKIIYYGTEAYSNSQQKIIKVDRSEIVAHELTHVAQGWVEGVRNMDYGHVNPFWWGSEGIKVKAEQKMETCLGV